MRRARGPLGRLFRPHRLVAGGLLLALGTLRPAEAQAQQTPGAAAYNTYGEIGMLDMPSAHMAPDGELAFTVGDVGNSQRYALTFQALPWLSASFRYSHIVGLSSGYNDWHYYDRSFGIKVRLVKEGNVAPDISLGIRDILGSGLYGAEYFAASKHISDFDLTAGLGWGRLGERGTLPNPLGYLFKSFKTRKTATTTGVVDFGQFLHGPNVGIFGGLAWQSPINGLKVLAEYSSDAYDGYIYGGSFKVRSPVNLGLAYRPFDDLAFSGGWFYGSTYGFTISLNGDADSEPSTEERIGPPVPEPAIRSSAQQQKALQLLIAQYPWPSDNNNQRSRAAIGSAQGTQDLIAALMSEGRGVRDVEVQGNTIIVDAASLGAPHTQCATYARIASAAGSVYTSIAMSDLQSPRGAVTFCPVAVRAGYVHNVDPHVIASGDGQNAALDGKLQADLQKQNLPLEAVSINGAELWLYFDNYYYRTESEALGRVVRVLMADAPPSVEIFHIVTMNAGIPVQQITTVRSALERTMLAGGTRVGLDDAVTIAPAPMRNPALMRQLIAYPRYFWSLTPKMSEHVFDPNAPLQFQFYGALTGSTQVTPGLTFSSVLTGNVWNDLTFTRPPGSDLPHVRTDILQYLKQGQYGISFLGGIYRARLTPDIFAELKAGYLEDMFMGTGGQVLWRPENSRFAFGLDVYEVWKRNFDRLFGIQSYHVLTGHASIYYSSPWYGLNFKVHVGRYLAGDYGGTFEITRRFSTGVEIGFYATFTNVPFHKFGEGSFDKGIIIHIPFEWSLPIFSQSSYDLQLSSLTRDGGQRLANDDSLYDETERTSDGEIAQHFDQILEP